MCIGSQVGYFKVFSSLFFVIITIVISNSSNSNFINTSSSVSSFSREEAGVCLDESPGVRVGVLESCTDEQDNVKGSGDGGGSLVVIVQDKCFYIFLNNKLLFTH